MSRRQTIPTAFSYTFEQFDKDFPDDSACLEQIKEQRFPSGITDCRKCGLRRKHYRVKGRTAYACETCGNHIYPLSGTILEKSRTPLRIWFHAMYLIGSTLSAISVEEIQRETGVNYKTAWRMFQQIRQVMINDLQSDPHEYSFRDNCLDSGNLTFSSIVHRVSEMASRMPALEAQSNPLS